MVSAGEDEYVVDKALQHRLKDGKPLLLRLILFREMQAGPCVSISLHVERHVESPFLNSILQLKCVFMEKMHKTRRWNLMEATWEDANYLLSGILREKIVGNNSSEIHLSSEIPRKFPTEFRGNPNSSEFPRTTSSSEIPRNIPRKMSSEYSEG
uniref:Uncharacterized protein n=1 Tax=Brassica oleracea var. oleracea TaxID=109376 RepID=A0A0D3E6U2_BRAOL